MAVEFSNLGVDLLLDEGDLQVDETGDLESTHDGRVTLLQDVKNVLDTLPGDLFSHVAYGAGLQRMVGESHRGDFEALVKRAIVDVLEYSEAVSPRIQQETIRVVARELAGESIEFEVSFVPIDADLTNRLNLVWGFNLSEGDL